MKVTIQTVHLYYRDKGMCGTLCVNLLTANSSAAGCSSSAGVGSGDRVVRGGRGATVWTAGFGKSGGGKE